MLTRGRPTRFQEKFVIETPGPRPGVSGARDLIPLRAVFGQDEANDDTERYPVDSEGLIWVPPEAVAPLTSVGGFVLARFGSEVVSVGMLKLHHEDGSGCSYRGRQFLPDANGDVLVPAEAVSELSAHGFAPALREE